MNRFKTMLMTASIVLGIISFTVSCSNGPDKTDMQNQIQSQITESLAQKGLPGVKCKSVALVKESKNKYTGIAEIGNDAMSEQHSIDVTVDGETFVWKMEN